jgi:hypothetical protein
MTNADLVRAGDVAMTIMRQIGGETLMCIGAHDYEVLNEKLGGVTFRINPNPKLRGGGRVSIVLDYMDTYDVKIFNNRGRAVYDESTIYCDMLRGPDGVIEQVTG